MPAWVPEIFQPHSHPVVIERRYSDFLRDANSGRIRDIIIDQNVDRIQSLRDDGVIEQVVLPKYSSFVDKLAVDKHINVTVKPKEESDFNILQLILNCFWIGMLLRAAFMLSRNGGGMGGMGMSKTKFEMKEKTNVKFTDVGGNEEAKQELFEVVDFLQAPEKYTRLGAKIPRGVLLYGPPGCSKTLLARAVAGEANVPFFQCSGSDFIEMFVGVGASRVRDLFNKAREAAPCIVFIDEIDAVGRVRGGPGGSPGGNDERDQTINQLLTMMDGFDGNTGVIVMAATNRPDVLDPALMRSGRFDRRVAVEMPDFKGRRAIFDIHTRGKPVAPDVNLESIARFTVGFSGADIENLCNEAALQAARVNRAVISTEDFNQAIEKLVLGPERRSVIMTEQKKRILAYHESGHALMGLLMGDFDLVRKVSIVPRGESGGATYFEPSDEHLDVVMATREYFEAKIMVALGGRIAEELVFGTMKITSGASGDLQEVYRVAYDMIARYGFSETLGKAAWTDDDGAAGEITLEIRALVDHLYAQAREMLVSHEAYLHVLAKELIERETLDANDIAVLLEGIGCNVRPSSMEENGQNI